MATGSKKQNRNKKQQRKPHRHLPKVGSPAENAYVQRESRRDLIDFGTRGGGRGPTSKVLIVVILVALALGILGLVLLNIL
jgi:hypothetical protein